MDMSVVYRVTLYFLSFKILYWGREKEKIKWGMFHGSWCLSDDVRNKTIRIQHNIHFYNFFLNNLIKFREEVKLNQK